MPSALNSPPWLSSRSWPENGRCYCQLPSKKYRKHHHHTRIPPHEPGCRLTIVIWEWGGSLLGNDVHAKAQTPRKSQLQSPGGIRRRIFCPVVVYMNLFVRKLAGGMCWFWVCAKLYDSICLKIWPILKPENWQFAKVPHFFLIVKIFTVFELAPFKTYSNQCIELIHQNWRARSPLSESVRQ